MTKCSLTIYKENSEVGFSDPGSKWNLIFPGQWTLKIANDSLIEKQFDDS